MAKNRINKPEDSKVPKEVREAIKKLWTRGVLTYKLHSTQKKLYEEFINQSDAVFTVLMGRRSGKSYFLLTLAIMECLRGPDRIVKYVCPMQKQTKTIVQPIMKKLLSDCPPELYPEWKENDKCWIFPNNSQIQLAGSDGGQYDGLRGTDSHLNVIDEAGQVDNLNVVLTDVLLPLTTITNGKTIVASTPSVDITHPFITEYVEPALAAGKLKVYTLYDNPMVTPEQIEKIVARYAGGVNHPSFQREYMCKIVRSAEETVFPEFTEQLKAEITKSVQLPKFYDAYVSADIAVRDLTVFLFAAHDHINDTTFILDEIVLRGAEQVRTDKIAELVRKKEQELFGEVEVFKRVMDNSHLILINDLSMTYDIKFFPTAKDNKEAAVNHTGVRLNNKRIIIDPKCKTLLYHLSSVRWRSNVGKEKEFKNLQDIKLKDGSTLLGGHADAADALIYLIRNINYHHNPYPENYGYVYDYNKFNPRAGRKSEMKDKIFKMLNIQKRNN